MASRPHVIDLLLLIPLILTVSIKNPKKPVDSVSLTSLTPSPHSASLTHSRVFTFTAPQHLLSLTHSTLYLHSASRPSLQLLQKPSSKPICSLLSLHPLVPPFSFCKNHLASPFALSFPFTLSSPPSPSSSAIRTHLLSPSLVLTISATDPQCKLLLLSTEIRGAEKFRQAGIELLLKLKFDRMFPGDIATGQYAWAPSSGAVGANEVDLGTSNVILEGDDLEKGSRYSEENANLNFENHISRGVGGLHMSSSSNTKSSGKRKEREHLEPRARKKKSFEIGAQIVSLQQQLLDIMSRRSDSISVNRDLAGCSIPEVMAEFQSIPGSTVDDEFFDLAVEFLRVRRNREIWASIIGIEKKYSWLQRNIARRKKA